MKSLLFCLWHLTTYLFLRPLLGIIDLICFYLLNLNAVLHISGDKSCNIIITSAFKSIIYRWRNTWNSWDSCNHFPCLWWGLNSHVLTCFINCIIFFSLLSLLYLQSWIWLLHWVLWCFWSCTYVWWLPTPQQLRYLFCSPLQSLFYIISFSS